MKRHSLIATLLGMLILPLVVSCTKPDDGGGTTNPTDPETPVTPITPIDPVNPSEPTEVWGVYNPGKKIRKVYESQEGQPKHLREVWNWNGNLLEEIYHFNSEGTLMYRKKFAYENNRLNRIETVDFYENIEDYKTFVYENNQLKCVNFYGANDIFRGRTSLAYENGKLCKMEYYYDGATHHHRTFIWDGNNVKEIAFTSLLDVSYAIRPEYDHNVNVMKGFLDWEMWDDNLGGYIAGLYSSDFFVSNNNVVKARIWANGALLSAHDLIYQYQYDGDGYPIQISTESRIIFYEYE